MPRVSVGDKIKKYRLEKGMTQEELGKELGVGKAAVQKYESGQVQNLKSAHIKKLCELFDKIPWDFIFDGEYENKIINSLTKTQAIQEIFGENTSRLLMPLTKLNEKGLEKIYEYACDLLKINEYKR